jgi:hypothetical protein
MSEQAITDLLGVRRARDVRRRYLKPLEEAGVLECVGGTWQLAEDWQAQVKAMFARDEYWERQRYGKSADEKQLEDDKRAREAYQSRDRHRPERAPSGDEMDKKREQKRKERPPQRVKIAEVDRRFGRKVVSPAGAYDLYERMMNQRIAELERDFKEWAS